MLKTEESRADCKLRTVICFMNANLKPAEIYHKISEVYGENAMSDEMLGKKPD